MFALTGALKDYAWGDTSAIQTLLGREPDGTPLAELWMGAHRNGPSLTAHGPLDQVIAAQPSLVGDAALAEFGELPYLFKVLAAAQPLSIQAHPTAAQARAGHAREDAAGLAVTAPERTYRDANHKPELICALTPFVARVGFRRAEEVIALLDTLASPELDGLAERARRAETTHWSATLSWLLGLDADAVTKMTTALVAAANRLLAGGATAREVAWIIRIDQAFPDDVGSLVALLLNHVELEPGQAVFLGAGNLHAYLHGTAVELMANSDNVIRGGLTVKHIDTAELLAVVDMAPIVPQVQNPHGAVHTYASPVDEFSLTRIAGAARLDGHGPRIALVTDGTWEINTARQTVTSGPGDAWFIGADEGPLELAGEGLVWLASVH